MTVLDSTCANQLLINLILVTIECDKKFIKLSEGFGE